MFGLGDTTLSSLEKALPDFDFAILVLTLDDSARVREQIAKVPRDNVLFELGLFMGFRGSHHVFVVHCTAGDTKLPSDLAGLNVALVKLPEDTKINELDERWLSSHLGPTAQLIRAAIKKHTKNN